MSLVISDLWPRSRQPAEPVARAQLQLLRLKLPSLSAAQRVAAVRLQLGSFFPAGHFAFACRETTPGEVQTWAWAVATQTPTAQWRRQWPETLLESASDGLYLVQRQPGYEAQHWHGGRLQLSQWWAQAPTAQEWSRFVRAAGEDADGHPMPAAIRHVRLATPAQPWLRGDNLPRPDPWQGWHWQLAALVVAMTLCAAFGAHWQTRTQLAQDKLLLAQLRKQRETALAERARFEQLRNDHEALLSLAPKLAQLDLLDRVISSGVLAVPVTQAALAAQTVPTGTAAQAIGNAITAQAPNAPPPPPPPTPSLAEWDYRNAQLKLTLDIPEGDIAMLDTTRRIEELANISGLKIGLESSSNSLTLSMRVDDAKPIQARAPQLQSKP